jgi:large subunit ribosomal protein L14e
LSDQVPELGAVVLSKAGRDAGRYFVVVGKVDSQYVLVADGDLRKIQNPKKKKIKHLDVKPVTIPTVKEKLIRGSGLWDAEIRRDLEALGYTLRDKGIDRN